MEKEKRIKKSFEKATEKMLNIITMAYDAIDYINEHHEEGLLETADYGLPELCESVQKAKLVESPTETDVKEMNFAIHGATSTLEGILADHQDAKNYLKANWPQASEILSPKKTAII